MIIKICDVCYQQNKKMVKSRYRTGYTGSIKIDLCQKCREKNIIKNKTKKEFIEYAYNLLINQ